MSKINSRTLNYCQSPHLIYATRSLYSNCSSGFNYLLSNCYYSVRRCCIQWCRPEVHQDIHYISQEVLHQRMLAFSVSLIFHNENIWQQRKNYFFFHYWYSKCFSINLYQNYVCALKITHQQQVKVFFLVSIICLLISALRKTK